ncbi:MAG TPA: SPOR domain-containing protein [Polyangiaceae bacterium]|nr:SPOR domain-containing protein [Polyangiaceae bacterium]
MDSTNIRNLEQIQEDDAPRRGSRLGTLVLASLAGGALMLAFVVTTKRQGPPARSEQDPLSALVAQAKTSGVAGDKLEGRDVTFPALLSDLGKPTTALAAVKDERGHLVKQESAGASEALPPAASDRLPVVPLPAGTLLSATPVTREPKDNLTRMAAERAQVSESTELAASGSDGGFQIQIASFKDPADADAFVLDLRKRGHKAFRQPAYVPDRGLWHRVRVGPFKNQYEADQYRKQFEKTERVAPFVVDPHKQKQAEETRAAKMEARVRRFGRP